MLIVYVSCTKRVLCCVVLTSPKLAQDRLGWNMRGYCMFCESVELSFSWDAGLKLPQTRRVPVTKRPMSWQMAGILMDSSVDLFPLGQAANLLSQVICGCGKHKHYVLLSVTRNTWLLSWQWLLQSASTIEHLLIHIHVQCVTRSARVRWHGRWGGGSAISPIKFVGMGV